MRARASRARAVIVFAAASAVLACWRQPAAPASWPAEIATIRVTSPVTWFAISRTQPLAATVSRDHKLRILSLPDGTERRAIDLGDRAVDVIALAPNGDAVAIGDHTGAVSVWSTSTGQLRLELKLHHYPGIAVFSNDGKTFAVAAQGDPVQLIDMATGKAVTMLGAPVGGTLALAFSPDDHRIACGDGDSVIRVYDAGTGKLISENHDFLLVPLTVAFTADGAEAVAGSGDKVLHFIDAATGKLARKLERTSQPTMFIDVSPDGKSFVTAYMKSEDMTQPDHIVVRSTTSGQQELDWLPPVMPAGGGWTSDSRALVALPAADALHLWRLR